MGSATYVSLNLLFMVTAWMVLRRYIKEPLQTYRVILLHLLILTAVFDALIIAAGIVAYDHTKLLGVYVVNAPIEDFSYSFAAAFVIPAIWRITKKKVGDESN